MNIYEEILRNQNKHVRDILARGPMQLSATLDEKPTDVLLSDGFNACADLWGQYLTVEVQCEYSIGVWYLHIKWTPINWKATKPYWSSHGTLFLPTKLASSQCPTALELVGWEDIEKLVK